MSEQAPSPLQTQLAEAIRDLAVQQVDAEHGYTVEFADNADLHRWCYDERERHLSALAPLVERLIADAQRRILTQATAAMRLRNKPFTDWIDEQRQWIDDWQNGYFSSTSRDEHGWPMEMHGLVQALGSAVDGLAALAGLATGPPPQAQDSLRDQIIRVLTLATGHGEYDAADWISRAYFALDAPDAGLPHQETRDA